jgi:hypothetical protein
LFSTGLNAFGILGSQASFTATGDFVVTGVVGTHTGGQTVASFTTPQEGAPSGISAGIDWGDGRLSQAIIVTGSVAGSFLVTGDHVYKAQGGYLVSVTIHHGGVDTEVSSTAHILDAPVVGHGSVKVLGFENKAFANQLVATFTDPGGAEDLSHYTASIDWGDGSATSPGNISVNARTGQFSVRGSHKYTEEGTYTLRVTVHDSGAPDAVITGFAGVRDQPVLAVGGFTITAVEGSNVRNSTLATFTDTADSDGVEDYSATIDWGDGSESDQGQITFTNGVFSVHGSHAYSGPGSFTIRVTIHHGDAPDRSVFETANISEAALSDAIGNSILLSEGSPFNGVVATFRDDNLVATSDDFSATIIWGDGHTSAGTIIFISQGFFEVIGANTYTDDGSFGGQVTILDRHGGAHITASLQANISAIQPTLLLSGEPESQAGSDFVLRLTVTEHGSDRPETFTIDWDDGSPPQTVRATGDSNTYLVHHVYTNAPNFFSITASFTDEDGAHAAAAPEQLTVLVPGLEDIVEGTFTLGNQGTHLTLAGTMWATYNFPASADSGDFVKVFLGRYRGNPEGSDLPEGSPLAYADVHLQFHVAGQPGGTVTLHFFLPDGLDPRTVVPQFFDDDWKPVVPHSVKTGIDSLGHNFIEITLSADAAPTPVRLTQTVFTIAVVTPAPATTTVIIPPLVSAAATNVEGDFRTTATFVPASQLTLSLSASPEQSVASSGGGDNKQSEGGGDDPLLEPLQWLLGSDEPDDWLFPGENKAPARAPKAKTTGSAPLKQPEQPPAQPTSRSEILLPSDTSSGYVTDIEITDSWLADDSDAPPMSERDLFFEQAIDSQPSSDMALQSGLALAVVLVHYEPERKRKREPRLC